MLEVDRLDVRYGDLTALNGVSVRVGRSERLAVLGPSGSGKSTLLRAIAGLERPTAGRILWNGSDLAAVPPHERNFGLMFQDYALFAHLDVAGNVAFGLRMRGDASSAIRVRVDEVLELVGLAGYNRRRVTALSGGEQQRVALARALAPSPRLLMLDEPLGALDRTLRERLIDELGAIFGRLELSVIYVTHDQEEALAVGDRVAVLNAGRLEAVARPVALWQRPPSEFVARFLGLRNIVDAVVDGDGRADTAWGALSAPLGTPPGRHRLLVRPDAVALAARGARCGNVVSASFRGSRTVVVVAFDNAPPLELHLAPDVDVPAVGEPACVVIPRDAVFVLL